MKTINELFTHLSSLDVKLWIEDDRLCCNAPEEVLTSNLSSELSQRKEEIIAFLNRTHSSSKSKRTISPVSRAENLPLSFAQQRLWFVDQVTPGSPEYNIFWAIRIKGLLNLSALKQSFNKIVQRHEVLRTNFKILEGQPLQEIAPNLQLELSVMDWRQLSQSEREARLVGIADVEAKKPFNLAKGPLLRITLIHLDEAEYVALLTMHHIVSDAWSIGIFTREIAQLYEAFSTGQPSPLQVLPIQYADFAAWQRQWLQGEVLNKQLSYWKKQLGSNPPVLQLPTDRPRPKVRTFNGSRQSFSVPTEIAKALKKLSQKEEVTLFMTLLTAFKTLLYRYTSQEDILIGSPIANRNLKQTESLIGFFINTLVLRTNLSGNPTFRDLLQRVKKIALEAYEHQDLPFEKLVGELQLERDLSYSPVFQVKFMLQNAPQEELKLPGLTLSFLSTENSTAKLDLSLDMYETASGLTGAFEYNTDLFDKATINRMVEHFCCLLSGIVNNPKQHLCELPLLSQSERHQLLVEWNHTQVEYPQNQCFHQLFEAQVEKTPDAVAVVFQDQKLTYRQLNQRANQLAHHLQKLGAKPEFKVGLCFERSPEMIVGLLGILKAGGAYLPLDPTYPQERLTFMLSDSQVPILLTTQNLVAKLPEHQAQVVCLDTDWATIAGESKQNPNSGVTVKNLAYLIYTSGSTGTPKGVLVPHQGLSNLTKDKIRTCKVQPDSRILQFFSLSFDASIPELVMALGSGAALHLGTPEDLLPGSYLTKLLREQAITHITLPPSALAVLPTAELPALQMVMVGGEATSEELITQWSKGRLFINAYGPTEVTVNASMVECGNVDQSLPTVRPAANKQLYILDQYLQPVPIGVPGELHISGVGLARGYLNRPEKTAETFIPNPFSDEPGNRLYKTGDLASYLSDGHIKLLGRLDHQVKIRGFRIEPGEIEALLSQHPGIQENVVVVREDQPGDKRLVAYIVPNAENAFTVGELRRFIEEKLPKYMIPTAFVTLDALPLNPNGKVDRFALPVPDTARPELEAAFVASSTATEQTVAEIFAQVLEVEQVGIHDDFFELGGHSLLATQAVSRLQDAFGIDLPIRILFEKPTIAELAEYITANNQVDVGSKSRQAITSVARTGNLPLSFAQQRLWFLDQMKPGNSRYNASGALRLKGSLDIAALEQSFNEIVRRHEALRTTFKTVDGQPVQEIAPTLKLELPILDWRQVEENQREAEVLRLAKHEAQQPFDLAKGPLIRVTLVHLAKTEYVALFTMHHIISDAWSMGVLVRELSTLYKAFSTSQPLPLPELPIQYPDFAVWQRQWLQGEVLQTQLSYWRKQLGGNLPVLQLPTDRPRSKVQTFPGATYSFSLNSAITQALKELSQQKEVTLFMTLLTAFKTLLYRYTFQEDILVGSPIANRNQTGIEGLIGFFVNTLVLRTNLVGNPSFEELLQRVREVALGAYAHQDLPFELLVEKLQPERDLSHTPLFQVVFVLQNAPMSTLELPGLTLTPVTRESETAKFDLTLNMTETQSGLKGGFEYNTDLFESATIARMAGHLQTLLEAIVANPQQRLSQLPLLTQFEQQQSLVEWNDTKVNYPQGKCIHKLFEAQVEKTPDAVAVVFEEEALTYAQLNQRANQLAHYLQQLGVQPEVKVGICVERSIGMVVGLLAILKAGGAYVPLDPRYPKERLAFMLKDACVSVLLTQERLVRTLPSHKAKIIYLDTDWNAISQENKENLLTLVKPDNLAYINYTSGSTGKPKGVEVLHRGVIRLLFGTDYVNLDAKQRFLQMASISFDASTFELWGALLHGARCVLFPGDIPTPKYLSNILQKHNITTLWMTAALFNTVIDDTPEAFLGIQQLLVGGEALSVSHILRAQEILPSTQIINGYGPTESTTFSCCYPIPRKLDSNIKSISIGHPIGNTEVYLLDAQLQPLPIGVIGELYIGGAGLARGYLNRPELTTEKFIPNPFSDESGSRLYKTGDLARYLPSGEIEYLGRIDHQVKVRGFRIELGEIEALLTKYPGVEESVVIAREDRPGDKRLVAYVVANSSDNLKINDLRSSIAEKLPKYAIPSAFVMLDELPLNHNGKVDRQALPAPDTARPELEAAFVAPRTATEQTLAEIFAQVLEIKQVGVHDDFFELGGHSLLITQLIARLLKTFEAEVSVVELFETSTVAALAERIAKMQTLEKISAPAEMNEEREEIEI